MKTFYVLLALGISFLMQGQSDVLKNNAVAYTLFKRLTRNHENLVCSPYGLRNSFAMVYPGAYGTSRSEIERTFKFVPKPEKQLELSKAEDKAIKGTATNIYNSIWVPSDAHVELNYRELIAKYTDEPINLLYSAQNVNQWVDTKSKGKIRALVDDEELRDVKVLLINCITFDDKWEIPFAKEHTKNRAFYSQKDSAAVPTMKLNSSLRALKNNVIDIVQLPYEGNMAMTLMMPAKGKSFEVIEAYCSADFLKLNESDSSESEVAPKLKPTHLDLFLPKFKIASTLNLIQPLKEMGMLDCFSDLQADFSLMDAEDTHWFISIVKQMATIEVREEGTKASAATVSGISMTSLPSTLHINRPFVYVLHDKHTGNILFMGQVKKP